MEHAKTWRLRRAIFERGWFNPAQAGRAARIDAAPGNVLNKDFRARRLDGQGHTLGKVIDAVTAIARTQEQHSAVLGKMHEGQMIIERDLSAIKMRVERIERHTGLVQA